jgi:hypothetical protein
MPDEEYLTVAEAAERIGFTIPRLRRLIARPPYVQHCRTVSRETRTGTRAAVVIPVSMLAEMASGRHERPQQEREREQGHIEEGRSDPDLAAAYERIIAEKDARIKDLTEALEHERERSRRHAEAHARLQALLAMTSSA